MRLFFKKTYYFWIVSRIILIILFACSVNTFSHQKYNTGRMLVDILLTITILLMIAICVFEYHKKKVPFIVKIVPGIFNIFFGLLLYYLVNFFMSQNFVFLAFCVPIWIITQGIFEIVNDKDQTKIN
jgi:hypothetical protein